MKTAQRRDQCEKRSNPHPKMEVDILGNQPTTDIKPYSCAHCPKQFLQRSGLQCHMQRHNGVKQLNCKSCGKYFLSFQYLVQHEKLHCRGKLQPLDADNKYGLKKLHTCEQCGKGSMSAHGLKLHCIFLHSTDGQRNGSTGVYRIMF